MVKVERAGPKVVGEKSSAEKISSFDEEERVRRPAVLRRRPTKEPQPNPAKQAITQKFQIEKARPQKQRPSQSKAPRASIDPPKAEGRKQVEKEREPKIKDFKLSLLNQELPQFTTKAFGSKLSVQFEKPDLMTLPKRIQPPFLASQQSQAARKPQRQK